uniref:Uncharacterized protein n=1 Tax=Sphaerodactylus townsendi TaxID=933632 RepID=A0ACB8EGE2_9SAUR
MLSCGGSRSGQFPFPCLVNPRLYNLSLPSFAPSFPFRSQEPNLKVGSTQPQPLTLLAAGGRGVTGGVRLRAGCKGGEGGGMLPKCAPHVTQANSTWVVFPPLVP